MTDKDNRIFPLVVIVTILILFLGCIKESIGANPNLKDTIFALLTILGALLSAIIVMKNDN